MKRKKIFKERDEKMMRMRKMMRLTLYLDVDTRPEFELDKTYHQEQQLILSEFLNVRK